MNPSKQIVGKTGITRNTDLSKSCLVTCDIFSDRTMEQFCAYRRYDDSRENLKTGFCR